MRKVLLCLIFVPNLIWSQSFERVDFYLNMNECLNCQMFLKNYVLAIQNSKECVLHADYSTKSFIAEYLLSKGVDPAVFDRIEYSDLNAQLGLFESFIIIRHNNDFDTLYIKEPLLNRNIVDQSFSSFSSDCFRFSDRIDVYSTNEGFLVWDIVFSEARRLNLNSEGQWVCSRILFDKKIKKKIQHHLEDSYKEISFELTDALSSLLQQIDMDGIKLLSMGESVDSGAEYLLLDIPYVYASGGDSVITTITVLQSSEEKLIKVEIEELDDMEIDYDLRSGFFLSKDTLWIPTFNHRTHTLILFQFVLEDGVMIFREMRSSFTMPEKYQSGDLSLKLMEGYIALNNSPFIVDIRNNAVIELLPLNSEKDVNFLSISKKSQEKISVNIIVDAKLTVLEYDLIKESDEHLVKYEIVEFQQFANLSGVLYGVNLSPEFQSVRLEMNEVD